MFLPTDIDTVNRRASNDDTLVSRATYDTPQFDPLKDMKNVPGSESKFID